MRTIGTAERRARLARRHGIDPARRLSGPEAATEAMTVLHATEPATVYLSVLARVDGLSVADVDRALYDDRTLVKQLAMRRTLFVFPRDLLPAAWGSASARVAGAEWRRTAKDVAATHAFATPVEGELWLDAALAQVLERLGEGPETAQALRVGLEGLGGTISTSPGTTWGGDIPVMPRLLTQLGLRGRIVRGRNTGHWRLSRPAWTLMEHWLDEALEPLSEQEGYAAIVRRWLATFGPGTTADVQWWLGGTVSATKRALADVGAVEVALDEGTGWVLPDDLEPAEPVEPWAALLPVLDPTVMGWKQRDLYLGPHGPALFDTNGNAGTTAWWDGRIVGCWIQDAAGEVHLELLEDVGAEARAALQREADRLTAWLGGVRVSTVYPSTAMKLARGRHDGHHGPGTA